MIAGATALLAGMLVSVRRGADGRRLSGALEDLEMAERVERARLAGAMVRLDSLNSRERMLRAAGALGLRPATDGEITFLAEPGEPGPARGGER